MLACSANRIKSFSLDAGVIAKSAVLASLRLHPAILERIEKLEAGGTGAEVTERWLRPIARLPHAEQLVAVAEQLDLTAGVGASEEGCGS